MNGEATCQRCDGTGMEPEDGLGCQECGGDGIIYPDSPYHPDFDPYYNIPGINGPEY